jgi:diguanylate cyclase (GGDEF)-like protein/PAS domain S-box-containing protein
VETFLRTPANVSTDGVQPDGAAAFASSAWGAIALLMVDPDGSVSAWSEGARRMLGYSEEEIVGKPLSIFFSPEDLREFGPHREIQEVVRATRAHFEGWWTSRNGGRVWVRRVTWLVRGPAGRIDRLGMLLSDLTSTRTYIERLEERERYYRTLFDQNTEPVFALDASGRITAANRAAEPVLDSVHAALGRPFSVIVAPEDREAVENAVDGAARGAPQRLSIVTTAPPGSPRHLQTTLIPVWVGGMVAGIFAASTDVTDVIAASDGDERMAAGAAGDDREELFRTFVESARDIFFFRTDARGHITYLSPSAAEILQAPPEALLGRTLADVTDVEADADAWTDPLENEPEEPRGVRTVTVAVDGGPRVVLEVIELPGGGPGRITHGMARDVGRQRQMEQELMERALHDPLTGVANRALFWERLQQAIRMAQRSPERRFALLMLDVDRFKLVNDTLGHPVGDEILTGIARRLEQCVRPGDTVCRFGGDEFVVLLDDMGHDSDAERVARRITDALAAPHEIDGSHVFATASIGIAVGTGGARTADVLVRNADTALYRAKATAVGGHATFDRGLQKAVAARLRLESELRGALERGEMRVEYQPVVSLSTGDVWGFEALVRWNHPERGEVSPAEFIPIAERTGQIAAIDLWVLGQACLQLAAWQRQLPDMVVRMSVNISGKELIRSNLCEGIGVILRESGVAPESLTLELRESDFATGWHEPQALLEKLGCLDVRFQIDHYGSGGSSLLHLSQLPMVNLKLDPAAISGDGDGDVVRAAVALAHSLHLGVVAQSVETREQIDRMRSLACDYVQGFALSPAVSAIAAEALLHLSDPFSVAVARA